MNKENTKIYKSIENKLQQQSEEGAGSKRKYRKISPHLFWLAIELSLPVLTTYVCRGWDSITQPSPCEANALTDDDMLAIRPVGCDN